MCDVEMCDVGMCDVGMCDVQIMTEHICTEWRFADNVGVVTGAMQAVLVVISIF